MGEDKKKILIRWAEGSIFVFLTIWRGSTVVSGSHAKRLDFEEVVGLKRVIKAFSSIATWLARLLIPFVLNGVDIIFDYTIPDVSVTWSEAQPTQRKELLSWLGWIAITFCFFFFPFLPQFNNKRVGYFFPPHYLSEEPNLKRVFHNFHFINILAGTTYSPSQNLHPSRKTRFQKNAFLSKKLLNCFVTN